MSTDQNIPPIDVPPASLRAAQYVRMSTEHQQYSTANQRDAIRDYAQSHNLEIVRTYADDGKSGLRIDGREALQRLIQDVHSGNADFKLVLVYDISRWGRFQRRNGSFHCSQQAPFGLSVWSWTAMSLCMMGWGGHGR